MPIFFPGLYLYSDFKMVYYLEKQEYITKNLCFAPTLYIDKPNKIIYRYDDCVLFILKGNPACVWPQLARS